MNHQDVKKTLGVCYYPEHWPEDIWKEDALKMAELGITYVRIGEFAWSRLEPKRDVYQFDWLKRSIDILHTAGLKVVLGTPTATPPKWLVDEMPDMLPVGKDGNRRSFGSRRHYTFSHEGYRKECQRIVTALANEFGSYPGIAAWQTDNEYDCHDTTLSYSVVDLAAFQDWLGQKYQSPDVLNSAWGNVFWSMEIDDFSQICLPNQTVTEANPAHWMDYRSFASDMVVEFNRLQVEILRKFSPGRDIIHNFMGRTLAFDHFKVGADLDISSWDAYPLGFLEDRSDRSEAFKQTFSRAGDPDFQAFHHDLYRATSKGRWWVMEQQPGPVNWAPHNPAPRDGMIRLWTLEAFAHGAETVSYFRWRQAPFAQEQMHSGLLRSNRDEAEAYTEVGEVAGELASIDFGKINDAPVAIVFDYASSWAWQTQPQGREFDYFRLVFDFYKALRTKGLTVDFIPSNTSDLSSYKLILIPGLFTFNNDLTTALTNFDGQVLIGPRSGSKTKDFAIPDTLPPALGHSLLDMQIKRVESLRGDCPLSVGKGRFKFWREFAAVGTNVTITRVTDDGEAAIISQKNIAYLCGWPDDILMGEIIHNLCTKANITMTDLPEGLRMVSNHGKHFVFNYSDETFDLSKIIKGQLIFGENMMAPSSFAIVDVSSR